MITSVLQSCICLLMSYGSSHRLYTEVVVSWLHESTLFIIFNCSYIFSPDKYILCNITKLNLNRSSQCLGNIQLKVFEDVLKNYGFKQQKNMF